MTIFIIIFISYIINFLKFLSGKTNENPCVLYYHIYICLFLSYVFLKNICVLVENITFLGMFLGL